jgi:hypothetical protein
MKLVRGIPSADWTQPTKVRKAFTSKALSPIEGQGRSEVDKDEIRRDEPIDLTESVVHGSVRMSRAGTQEITISTE